MMILGFLFWVMPLLMVLVAGVWAIVAIVRSLTVPGNLAGKPVCAVCSYPVASVSIERCPECGTPYLAGGIRTPRSAVRDRGSTASAVIAWTFLAASVGFIASMVFMAVSFSLSIPAMAVQTAQGIAVYRPIESVATPGVVREGPDYTLEFTVDGTWDLSGMGVDANGKPTYSGTGTIGVTLLIDQQPQPPLVFDLSSTELLPEADALAMFQAAGLDVDDEVIGFEARQLPVLLNDWISDPTHGYEFYESMDGGPISGDSAINPPLRNESGDFIAGWGEVEYTDNSVATAGMFGSSPPTWYVVSAIGTLLGLLAIWGVGIWLIVRRRRSILLRLSTPPAAA